MPESRYLTTLAVIAGAACLLIAPHVAVTREDHCGVFVTMHMLERDWTLIFSAAAFAGIAALIMRWLALTAIVGAATGGFGISLMSEIRGWYSYQKVPEDLDLMGHVFGHVLDIALPLVLVGCGLFVLAAMAVNFRSDSAAKSGVARRTT